MSEEFEKLPLASFSVFGVKNAFPVLNIKEDGGNRIVKRERPYRDGAKLDDTGSMAKMWVLECLFENTIQEKDLEAENLGNPLYPNVLNSVIALFDIHATGDLVVPTRGDVRARAESYSRTEVSDEKRDAALLTLTFVEDNEDTVGPQQFSAPSAEANSRRLQEATTFDAESAEMWDPSLADLNEFASELEAIATFPGDTVNDLDAQATIVVAAANRVGRAFTEGNKEGRDKLNDPSNSSTARKLEQTKDIASRALLLNGSSTKTYRRDKTLFGIAADESVSLERLIFLNSRLNPFHVPAGTPVRVPN